MPLILLLFPPQKAEIVYRILLRRPIYIPMMPSVVGCTSNTESDLSCLQCDFLSFINFHGSCYGAPFSSFRKLDKQVRKPLLPFYQQRVELHVYRALYLDPEETLKRENLTRQILNVMCDK